MESSDEAVDDQGSGWFQMKKRHRTFSVESWVGGFTTKSSSNLVSSLPPSNDMDGSSHSKRRSHLQKAGRNFPIHDQGGKSNEDKKGVYYPDKCVVKEDSKCSKTKMPPLFVNNCNGEIGDNSEIPLKNNPNVVHKFKWGALEDDDLVLHHQNSLGAEIKFGDIGDDNLLACRKHENNPDLVSGVSSTTFSYCSFNIQQTRLVATKVDAGFNSNASTCKEEIIEETSEEVNDKISDAVKLDSDNDVGVPNVNEKIIERDSDVLDCKERQSENLKPTKDDHLIPCYLSGEEAGLVLKIEVPVGVSEVEESGISEVPVTDGVSSAEATIQSTESLTPIKGGPEVSGGLDVTDSVGDSRDLQDGTIHDDLSESHVMGALGEVEPAEKNGPVVSGGSIGTPSVGESGDPQDGTIQDSKSHVMSALGESETAESGHEVSGGSTLRTSVEDSGDPRDGKMHDDLSKPQIMSVLGEGEIPESKERLVIENNEEAVDDKGSAWFRMKKKNRSSPRFSIQSWVGGFTAKSSSHLLRSPPPLDEKVGSSHGKHRSYLQKAGRDFPIDYQGGVANSTAWSNQDKKGMYDPDKRDVKQDYECSKVLPMLVNNCNGEIGDSPQIPLKNKPDGVHKFKLGALEDEDLVPHHQNSPGAEIKFTDIRDDVLLAIRKHKNNLHLVSSSSSSSSLSNLQQTVLVAKKTGVDINYSAMAHRDVIIEENYNKANDKISDIAKLDLDSNARVLIVNKEIIERDNSVSDCNEMHSDDLKPINDDHLSSSYLSDEDTGVEVKPEAPVVSKVPVTDEVSSKDVIIQGTESLPPEEGGLEISGGLTVTVSVGDSGDPHDDGMPQSQIMGVLGEGETPEKSRPWIVGGLTMTASVGNSGDPQDGTIHDYLSKAQVTSGLGDGETAESKDWFRQRLWCFLFENLNRAIDELYLLCELECDLEQMKEAILVLEEAASDFTELTTRVEEFENAKKSSSQLTDGVPITLKTDHRRPHALSWEVRRMTTSPHRAEIMASSLEAFRKIQQERASLHTDNNVKTLGLEFPMHHHISGNNLKKAVIVSDLTDRTKDLGMKLRRQSGGSDLNQGSRSQSGEKQNVESGKSSNVNFVEDGGDPPEKSSIFYINSAGPPPKNNYASSGVGKNKREHLGSETEKLILKKDKMLAENVEKNLNTMDHFKKQGPVSEKDKEKRNATSWKTMDAWKEKRNWGDILSSPLRASSRISHSPGMSRKNTERARILHEKLMSPEKKKKTAVDLKKEAEEKHARAMRIRSELENERIQKLQRTSEKLNRVNEWQAVRSMKLREGMHARHQCSESRHEAYLAQVVRRAGDESSKVNEVRFITSLNEENKKLMLRQKLHDSELRRAEKLQVMKIKQKEDIAREEAVLERRKLIEAEKFQRLAETQRKKEEAQVRREEERKASSAAREARAIEQLRRKEKRAKAQQEEAELLAQKLAEKLSESEQRRKFYLEQIRERASMDFRDQSSPLLRRSINKEGQGRSTPTRNVDDYQANADSGSGSAILATGDGTLQHSLKRRIKRIRQRLMAMKYEFPEPSVGFENAGIGFRAAMGTARAKISRWLQELKRLRQARKEGAASIGLITAELIKFLEGKEAELHASRQAGLLDFIASALPASHTSKPEACQVTINLVKLLSVILSAPANRSYFLVQNLLPPLIPMLSAALENYIKIAASLNVTGSNNLSSSKTSVENFESLSEVLDGFLWTVTAIIGNISSDDRQLQMRDGLLELLIAYQVIHRLQDLFALYDRPQVEGSPFPSTILLSIHLLVVLTSRPGASASIEWESWAIETVPNNEIQEAKFADPADSGYFCVTDTVEDRRPLLSVINGSTVVPLPDVPDDRPSNDSCKMNKNDKSMSIVKDSEKKPTDNLVELNDACMADADVSDESQKILIQQKDEKHLADVGVLQKNENISGLKPVAFLLSAISETGLVSLPSLLTSVLLQANNRLSSEQASYVLPSNFEEVAAGVLKVLNNLALLDMTFMQRMLARPDLKMEFFHLMSFLLSHCTSKWKSATDQVGCLLLESLLLLGYFALFHPGNQAVLRWGKSPTILHKVCDLPFVFFSDPELMPALAGTLVAACYGCEQNKGVIQLELSLDMLLTLLKSCRNVLPAVRSNSALEDLPAENTTEGNHQISEFKKLQGDIPLRSSRCNARSTRAPLGKSAASGNSFRVGKIRNPKDSKGTKTSEEMAVKHSLPALEASIMLQCRFPSSFIDRAEQFFSTGITDMGEGVRIDHRGTLLIPS